MIKKYTTKNFLQTQKIGEKFAADILKMPLQKTAVVLSFNGNLGGGKTTFIQGFAKGLGVKRKILSPTFVVMKRFELSGKNFKNFYHIDCYRLKDEKDILELDFKKILSNPENIIAVEWPEKIKKALSKKIVKLYFNFVDKNIREINIETL